MASLMDLPQEMSMQISKYLRLNDRFRLSATCKHYRSLLLPQVFNRIWFTNDEKSATSALVAIQAHGKHTTSIKFKCHASLYDLVEEPVLPPAVLKILEGQLTPNLRTVQLEFDFQFNQVLMWDPTSHFPQKTSIYLFEAVEGKDFVQEQEQIRLWRAMMNETWQALSANNSVRRLFLRNFIPKSTSTFHTHEFQQFLSQIDFVEFNILGLNCTTGRTTNTVEGYRDFLANLDSSFFHHMRGLKHLQIRARNPLGLEGRRHIPLALKPTDLPVLETLILEDCFVGPELVSFIQGHTNCLKTLGVKECVSAGSGHGMGVNAMSWAEFFDEVYKAKPSLTKLIAGGGFVPLTDDEEFDPEFICSDEPKEVQDVRQKLKADPKLKLFGYGYLDDEHGTFFLNGDNNVKRFNSGDDQRAYDRLMGLVKDNAARRELWF